MTAAVTAAVLMVVVSTATRALHTETGCERSTGTMRDAGTAKMLSSGERTRPHCSRRASTNLKLYSLRTREPTAHVSSRVMSARRARVKAGSTNLLLMISNPFDW